MAGDTNESGTVYLVGAGPGHPGLITRLGYDLLQQCNAVAYDALIPRELIAGLPEKVEKYYVGKRSGRHSLPQPDINELLVKLARRGLSVVRLKGGDPFIFGRLGEEAEYLSSAGVRVIMIPGVTAASAAAAMSGFSLTNRRAASWIFLGTGHGAENLNIPVPWDQIAELRGGTLVIYMGLAKLDHMVERLLRSGLPPDTPGIVTQAASTGIQRSVEAPLAKLIQECESHRLKPPALVIIGEAVRCRGNAATKQPESLAGRRILITSPSPLTALICRLLRMEGAEPIPYPTIIRKPAEDAEGWERLRELAHSGGICVFADDVEAGYFYEGLLVRNMDVRSLGRLKVIACGISTKAVLLERGINPDEVCDGIDPDNLGRSVSSLTSDALMPLIWAGGAYRQTDLMQELRTKCREIIPLALCMDSVAVWEDHWKYEILDTPPDYSAFTSAAEVDGLIHQLGLDAVRDLSSRSTFVSRDGSIAEALVGYGLPVHISPVKSGIKDLVSAIIRHAKG